MRWLNTSTAYKKIRHYANNKLIYYIVKNYAIYVMTKL